MSGITRRDFFRVGAGAAATAATGLWTPGSAQGAPQETPLRYQLISVPDHGTELDVELARNTKEVAEHVITKSGHPGIHSYRPGSSILHIDDPEHTQSAEVEIKRDGSLYTVSVLNFKEGETPDFDRMAIWIENVAAGNPNFLFIDSGLDGRCNLGMAEGRGSRVMYVAPTVRDPEVSGPEHREYFMQGYQNSLQFLRTIYGI